MSASGYVKGQITRAANALKEKITGTETTMTEIFNFEQQTGNFGDKRMVTKFATQLLEAQVGLSHWMNNLTNAWKRGEEHAKQLDEEQTRYQLLQELTDHWEKCSAEKFMINAQLLTQSTEYLKQTMEESLSNETKPTKAYSKDSSELQVQLPRLEIPHFQGDMVEFPEFWELYKLAVHDNTSLGAPAKFLHLKSVLKGTAKDLMATMTLSAENYPKAIELLLNTYNRPDVLRNRLIDQLEALPPSGKAVTEQRITLCKVKAIWVQLANLSEQPGSTMTMRMVSLDRTQSNSSNSPVRFKKHTQGKSRRDSSTDSNRGAHSKRTFRSKDKPNNTKQQRCSFCLQPRHKTANCDEVTSPYERREAVIHNRLCWKCLKPGHKSQDCEAPACYRCGRNHHKSLCLQRRSSLSPRRPGSPGNRYYRRNSSVDSYSSEVSRRNRSRSSSRSPSPDERGRSPTRRTRPYRRGSPHPKVGFRNQARTYAYSNSSPTPSSDRSQSKHMANSELDSSSEELESTAVRVNTVNTKAIITHTSNKKQRSSKDKLNKMLSPPQLMVVQALTVNKNTKSKQAITVLLDSGSQHSYIKKETAANLGLKLKNPQNITALTFGGHLHTEKSYRVEIILHNKKSGLPTKLHLWTRKAITSVEISKSSNKLGNNHKGKTTEVEVDVLIGMDYYWDVVHFNSSRQLPSGLVESETTLGPVLSGCQSSTSSKTCTVSEASPEEDNQSHETDRIGFVGNVPRFIAATGEAKYDLVIFSDASQRVYAAVAYLVCRPVKGTPFSNLIFAKAKLAVMKKTSIPRLELLGSVLAAKLVRFLRKQINIPLSSVHLLSDSQIALYWIHSNKQLKTFVNNRVKYIKEEEFRSAINTSSDTYKSFIPFTRTNSYKKLVRIASYVLKYVAILWRRTRKSSSSEDTSFRILHLMSETQTITASDMKAAEILLLREHYREEVIELQSRVVQRLRISLGEDGIYRGDLRMANADIADSAKTPVLLLPKHQLTRLIVTDLHEKLFHAGTSHLISELRNHYLIPRIRRVVNIVIGKCVVCKKHQGRSFSYPRIPDLPSQRVLRVLDSHEEINSSYVLLQETLNTFWDHWHKEYLQNLAERNQKRFPSRQGAKDSPNVGDVVLIKTENTPRSQWPLGLIVQIFSSADGSIRSVKIKTGNNKFLDRSVNQLIPLEVCASDVQNVLQSKKQSQPTRIQPERKAKQR
ncbi:zinc knuckle [Ostertagia ostertagi]